MNKVIKLTDVAGDRIYGINFSNITYFYKNDRTDRPKTNSTILCYSGGSIIVSETVDEIMNKLYYDVIPHVEIKKELNTMDLEIKMIK